MIWGDSLSIMEMMDDGCVECVIADPPYGDTQLINASIREARRLAWGPSLYFMYAEDLCHLDETPDQVLFWTKPISTKNTKRRYSRFVEVIAAYDLDRSPFNTTNHWSVRSGIFTDSLIEKSPHPHAKPVSLIEKLLVVHTEVGDLVLDPFAGAGTVERACDRLNRRCLSVEIDPEYALANTLGRPIIGNGIHQIHSF